MTKALDQVVDLLNLEQIEVDIFRGRSPDRRWSRPAGRCRRTAPCTRCTPTSSGRVTRRSR